MLSFAYLFGNMSYDYFFGNRSVDTNVAPLLLKTNMFMGIILVVSGLINMIILLKEKPYIRNFEYYVWRRSFEAMFLAAIFCLTPLFDFVLHRLGVEDKNVINKYKLIIVCFMFAVSPGLRFYRENYLQVKKGDLLTEEVKLN